MAKKPNIITQRIKEEYGTVKFFCKKNNLNYNTVVAVMYGVQRSPKILKILKEKGFLRADSEIPTNKNAYDRNQANKEQVA